MKYIIDYEEKISCRLIVEAESKEDAHEKFWSGEYDLGDAKELGGEVLLDEYRVYEAEKVSA